MARTQDIGDLYRVPARPAKKYSSGMPKIKRTLPAIPSGCFRFRDGTFTAHWTALREFRYNSYMRIQSQRTDAVVDFDLEDVVRGRAGEALELVFRGTGSHADLRVRIDARGL